MYTVDKNDIKISCKESEYIQVSFTVSEADLVTAKKQLTEDKIKKELADKIVSFLLNNTEYILYTKTKNLSLNDVTFYARVFINQKPSIKEMKHTSEKLK